MNTFTSFQKALSALPCRYPIHLKDKAFLKVKNSQKLSVLSLLLIAVSFGTLSAQTFTFTNAGATGQNGPSQTQVNNTYASTTLDGKVTATGGIQYWVVPATGYYKITALGAQGGSISVNCTATGGRGAKMEGEFFLTGGTTLKILVGQQGISNGADAGSGGGTFVTTNTNTPIIIAGGGGGASNNIGNCGSNLDGVDASITTSGTVGANGGGTGGTNGNGGISTGGSGGGGGGLLTDGSGAVAGRNGTAFVNGGTGATGSNNNHGGFGGGASGWHTGGQGGGGGGYSGGGTSSAQPYSGGGGGGSFNSGSNQNNLAGVQTGHGMVVIEVLSSGAYNDAGVIGIDSPNVYCAGIHNVVATVQNYGVNKLDSVTLNWSVNGIVQTPIKYIGTIDTIGGQGAFKIPVTLGSYNFNSSAYDVKAWTSLPNGTADTVNTNDTAKTTKQANLPPPTGLTKGVINAYNATIHWTAGAITNTWAYVNSTSNVTPVGPGTVVSGDSAYITGLSPTTTYYFFVREICHSGDSSVWAGPLEYRTPCANILSGTYTIDPGLPASSTNFTSFSDAAFALDECGISAPVEFHIAAGTYTERITLGEISGASATNTVSFIGSGITNTILTYDASGTGNMATVLLNGTDYTRFRDMTVRGTDISYGVGFLLTNEADYNTFDNMRIQMNNGSTSGNTAGIAISGSATATTTAGNSGNYNTFDSLNITGAYYGFTATGISTTGARCYGNKLSNSTFTNQYNYGIRFYSQNEMLVENNRVSNFRTATNYGMYIYYSSDYVISGNNIASTYTALRLYNGDRYTTSGNKNSLVANNILYGSGSYYTIYCYYTYDAQFYHNTIVNEIYSGNAYFTNCNNLDARNNIFLSNSIGNTGYAIYLTGGSQDELDYNVYYSKGTSFVYHNAARADFDSWKQAFPLFNENSYEFEPAFVSQNDPHLDQSMVFLRGIDLGLNIDTDVDGDARCNFAPTIGADESYFPTPSPTAAIASPDTVYDNSPTSFYSAFNPLPNVPLDYTWYVDGVQTDKGKDYTGLFAAGTYNLSMKIRSCSGSDSLGYTFTSILPTSTPVSDFSASKLVINELEEVQFTDLSDFGPTSWEWTVNPYSDAFFDNPFAANPKALFIYSGQYEICLKTENAFGTGTTKCKTAYISVNDVQSFCSASGSDFASGVLTDDGGTGNYGTGRNCSFIIKPCADEITLRFSEFDLADKGDVLSIYDGIDNTAPLIGTYTAGSGLPGGHSGLIATSGKMYLEWTTDGSGSAPGFSANWTSTPDTRTIPPATDFSIPDTVFTGKTATFTSTGTTGILPDYSWDFDPPNYQAGFEGGSLNFDRYSWSAAGVYPVQLSVTNCGGTDVITKNVNVIDPISTPVVGFYADKLRVPVLSTVTFFDTSHQGAFAWKWEITPALTSNIIGPDNQRQMQASFMKSGLYTVTLKATNSKGMDSLVKVDYIEVFDYCSPVAGNLSSDIGISRVKVKAIDNITPIGQSRYTSYLNDFNPQVIYKRGNFDITLERNSTTDFMNRKVWIDWNNDGDFNDSLELVAVESAAKTLAFTANVSVPNFNYSGFTTMRIGTSYGSDNNTPCGINPTGEFEDYPLQVTVDNVLPVITLTGADSIWLEQWHQYVEAGATAFDNVDGDITGSIVRVSNVDSTVAGTYYVTYDVTDMDGNVAQQVTRVVIITPDVTAPVITLIGNSTEDVTVLTVYNDPGAAATDYFNQNLTGQIISGDNIDLSILGTYYIWYTVEDAAGNKDSVVRIINVIDDVDPMLTLLGNDTISMEVFGQLNDPGYTVSDNYYSTVQVSVDMSLVNTSLVGIYPMTYTAEDSSGNTTVLTRYISVEDNTLPVITLIGSDTVIVDVFSSYSEQGAFVTDNYCSGLLWNVDVTPNTNVVGEYLLTYSATDCQGNEAIEVTRLVKVLDREAPIVTLNGAPSVSVIRWQAYTDAGVTVSDNYDDTSVFNANLQIISNFNVDYPGTYSICYYTTDASGNRSTQACRTITVVENTTGVQQLGEEISIKAYPNPTSGKFTLNVEDGSNDLLNVEIMNLAGQVLKSQQLQSGKNETLDISEFSEGMYLIKVSAPHYTRVVKMQLIN